jgi:CRP-like cAMP-binding protein
VHEEAVAEREMQRRTAALRTAGLFAASDASELRAIASRLVHTPYARGAVVLRQGQVAHSMYVLARGRAEVAVEVDSRLDIRTHATPGRGTRRVIGVLTDGAIFGEMGLMTGKARAATVIAATELDCYRLDKNAFEDILQSRPRLAEEIVQIMLSRRDVLEAAQGEMDTVQAAQDVPEQQTLLLARIRRFFGLVGDDHDVALPARARR